MVIIFNSKRDSYNILLYLGLRFPGLRFPGLRFPGLRFLDTFLLLAEDFIAVMAGLYGLPKHLIDN